MRISDGSSCLELVQKVANELNVRRNEVNGVNRVRLVVLIILASLYDNDVCDKNFAKSKCSKKVEEGLKHRVANSKLKAEGRKAEEEG